MKTTKTPWQIPVDSFTHTEMAQLNNTSNQAVWAEYKRLRDEGFIVSAGLRKGKGKPTGAWKVADGCQIVTDASAVPVKPVKPAKTEIVSSLVPVVDSTKQLIEKVDMGLPVVMPTKSPVVMLKVIEVPKNLPPKKQQPVASVSPVVPLPARSTVEGSEKTDYKCPMCDSDILSKATATGIRVWCCGNGPKVCPCYESPFGYSNNVKNAFEILCQKYAAHK